MLELDHFEREVKFADKSCGHGAELSDNEDYDYCPMWRFIPVGVLCILFAACRKDESALVQDFRSRPVTLPDGTTVRAEVMMQDQDMQRGMMFRESLPEGNGMLFIHSAPGKYTYWMYQVKIPLDIIWMDARGRVVEISENTPPCKGAASQCVKLNYGGNKEAMVVLELPAGYGRKHGVAVGEIIRF